MNLWHYESTIRDGLSHIQTGRPCQDFAKLGESGSGSHLAAAVADGLGSLRHSELASSVAVEASLKWLLEKAQVLDTMPEEEVCQTLRMELLPYIDRQLHLAAHRQKLDIGFLDCNLAFLLLSKTSGRVILGQLGDCAICVLAAQNRSRVLTAGGASANGTATVLGSRAQEQLQTAFVHIDETLWGFLLTTDGLDGEVYQKTSPLVRHNAQHYFNCLFQPEPKKQLDAQLQELQELSGKRFDDDMGLAVIALTDVPIELPADPMWQCSCGHANPTTMAYCGKCHRELMAVYPKAFLDNYNSLDEAILALNQDMELTRRYMVQPEPDVLLPEAREPQPTPSRREVQADAAMVNRLRNAQTGVTASVQLGAPREQDPRSGGSSDFVANASRSARKTPNSKKPPLRPEKPERPSWFLRHWKPIVLGVLGVALAVALAFAIPKWDFSQFLPLGQSAPENYWGQTKGGKPHGSGILLEDGYYWIGTFVDGEKDGVFQKIPADDFDAVTFSHGQELSDIGQPPQQTTAPPANEPAETTLPPETTVPPATEDILSGTGTPYRTIVKISRWRETPDAAVTIAEKVPAGSIVYATGKEESTDSVRWCEVTYRSQTFWVQKGDLELYTAPNTSND